MSAEQETLKEPLCFLLCLRVTLVLLVENSSASLSLLTGLFEVLIVTQGACLFTPVLVKTALFSTQVECCFAPVSNTPFCDIEVVTFTLNDCE